MCSCHSILECCVILSGVKLRMGSFVLFIIIIILVEDENSDVSGNKDQVESKDESDDEDKAI